MSKKTNVDEVIKAIGKMEGKGETIFIRAIRSRLVKVANDKKPEAQKRTPIKTGHLREHIKVKSKTIKGNLNVQMKWESPHAWLVNDRGRSAGFMEAFFHDNMNELDEAGRVEINRAMTKFIEGQGGAVK